MKQVMGKKNQLATKQQTVNNATSTQKSFCKEPKGVPSSLGLHYFSKPFPARVQEALAPHFSKIQTYFSPLERIFNNVAPGKSSGYLLNVAEWIQDISGFIDPFRFEGSVGQIDSEDTKLRSTKMFLKRAHILHPITYMSGKYVLPDDGALPSYHNAWQNTLAKINEPMNEAYVDALFAVCASRLVEQNLSPHFVRCHGVFCGRFDKYMYNLTEDYDDVRNEPWFTENLANGIFELRILDEQGDSMSFKPADSFRKPRRSIVSDSSTMLDSADADGGDLVEVDDFAVEGQALAKQTKQTQGQGEGQGQGQGQGEGEGEEEDLQEAELDDIEEADLEQDIEVQNFNVKSNLVNIRASMTHCGSSGSSSSGISEDKDKGSDSGESDSGSSDSGESDSGSSDIGESDSGSSEDSGDSGDNESDESEGPPIIAIFKNFPVMATVMECCDGTMDKLLDEQADIDDDASPEDKKDKEIRWCSWIFQVVSALAVAQKYYHFVHNDLHTNNIMWSATEKTTLYYHLKDALGGSRYYAVPTFGKIFKIIDFNRANYHLGKRGGFFISDAYESEGDAYGQYNCGPYYNQKQARIDPNPSFDLCRLACSLLDSLYEDEPESVEPKRIMTEETGIKQYETKSQVYNLLWTWLQQKDGGGNVLRNSNGTERYPGFDLYKKISTNVTSAIPCEQLTKPIFDSKYRIKKQDIPAGDMIWELPCSL